MCIRDRLWADLRDLYIWIALFGYVSFGVIGFVDDYAKVTNKRNLGLTAWQKFAMQMAVAALITGVLALMQYYKLYTTTLNVPFIKGFRPDLLIHAAMGNPYTYVLGFLMFYVFVVFVVVGSSNAVNVTDGLDGLAAGLIDVYKRQVMGRPEGSLYLDRAVRVCFFWSNRICRRLCQGHQ